MNGDRYDYVWDESLGEPTGDPQDLYTRQAAGGWYERAMREAKERGFYTRIVKCRQCKTNWAPAEFGRCYAVPACRPWRNEP